jgi:hypothetical protein
VFFTQLIRLALMLGIRRLRTASISQVWDVFALEGFTFPALLALYLWLHDHYLFSLSISVMTIWPSAMLCTVTVYVIYRLTYAVWRNRTLTSVIPAAVTVFCLFAFINYVVSSQAPPTGLSDLSSLIFNTLLKTRSIGLTPQVLIAGVPLYLSLATFAAVQGDGPSRGRNAVLLLVVIGTTLTIGLTVVAADVAVYPSLVFGVPGACLVTLMWLITRAR